jgi:UPF0271 protein
VHEDANLVGQQVIDLQHGFVKSSLGNKIALKSDTICIHGDGPHALEFAKKIRQLN